MSGCFLRHNVGRKNPANAMLIFSIPFARWKHYIRQMFALSGSGKQSFNPILDPNADANHHQNLITSKLGQISPATCNFLSNPANEQRGKCWVSHNLFGGGNNAWFVHNLPPSRELPQVRRDPINETGLFPLWWHSYHQNNTNSSTCTEIRSSSKSRYILVKLTTSRVPDSADDKQLVRRDKTADWIAPTLHDDHTLACDSTLPLRHTHQRIRDFLEYHHHHHHYSACTISAYCVAPLAVNSPHSGLSRAISIASSKVRLCRIGRSSEWPSRRSGVVQLAFSNHSGELQSEFSWHRLTHLFWSGAQTAWVFFSVWSK